MNLCKGVFPTGILRVKDFRGTLRGAGPDKTVLRALPDLPTTKTEVDFYRGDPFSDATDPWPYLLQFVEGKARILDLAIEIPAPSPGSKPTNGWNWFGFEFTALKGGLLLTGRDPVDFTVRHVRVEAGRLRRAPRGSDRCRSARRLLRRAFSTTPKPRSCRATTPCSRCGAPAGSSTACSAAA